MRIAISEDLGDWPVDPEVRANTLAVGEALRDAGATSMRLISRFPKPRSRASGQFTFA